MANLIYAGITSLDGYVVDADGNFDWAAPDAEVHAFVNELERPVGTYLYGRRMYEVMRYWDTASGAGRPSGRAGVRADLAGRGQDRLLRHAHGADTARTRLERTFDPARVRDLKASSDADLSVGGPHLAAAALRAGLVDEVWLILAPVVVGGGTAMFPDDSGWASSCGTSAGSPAASSTCGTRFAADLPSGSPGDEDVEVALGVAAVLPLLAEDDGQALANREALRRRPAGAHHWFGPLVQPRVGQVGQDPPDRRLPVGAQREHLVQARPGLAVPRHAWVRLHLVERQVQRVPGRRVAE